MKRHFGTRVRWAVLALVVAALLLLLSLPGLARATEGAGPGGNGSQPVEGPPYAQALVGDRCLAGDLNAVQVDLGGPTLDPEAHAVASPGPGAGVQSLSGSYAGFENCVNNARQGASCYTAGTQAQFCFIADFAGDEGARDVWLKFPSNWAVSSLSVWNSTGCARGTGAGWGYFAQNDFRLYWNGSTAGCTLWVCVTGTPPSGTSTQYVSWYLHGSTGGTTCSDDNYTPPYTGWPACAEAVESRATVPACNSSNVDGVWGAIDTDDATCSRWATGWKDGGWLQAFWDDELWNQTDTGSYCTGRNTDWNQVRYGVPADDTACDADTNLYAQSGFMFDGDDDIRDELQVAGTPFVVGRFCHNNNPILGDGLNYMSYVPLNVTVNPLVCPPGSNPSPASLTFSYLFNLDETANVEPCAYLGTTICPDAVTISQAQEQTYQCGSSTYTISGLGFIEQEAPYNGCTTYNAANVSDQYISDEGATNCACLWARVIAPLSVDLKRFEAWPEGATIHVQWETNQEVDNLGFNLYRSNTRDGLRVKLNRQLIPTLVPPGSPFGAVYDWIDSYRLRPGRAYFYWLEDVDIYGNATLHEPVRVRLR